MPGRRVGMRSRGTEAISLIAERCNIGLCLFQAALALIQFLFPLFQTIQFLFQRFFPLEQTPFRALQLSATLPVLLFRLRPSLKNLFLRLKDHLFLDVRRLGLGFFIQLFDCVFRLCHLGLRNVLSIGIADQKSDN